MCDRKAVVAIAIDFFFFVFFLSHGDLLPDCPLTFHVPLSPNTNSYTDHDDKTLLCLLPLIREKCFSLFSFANRDLPDICMFLQMSC